MNQEKVGRACQPTRNEPLMEEHWQIEISASAVEGILAALWQKGMVMPFLSGCTLQDLLCRQLGLSESYVRERITTLFLNGKVVDDPGALLVDDGARIALSAAMPGLAGAVLRRGGVLAPMRAGISGGKEGLPQEVRRAEGLFHLRLFNLVAVEVGGCLLQRGGRVRREDLLDILWSKENASVGEEWNLTCDGVVLDKKSLSPENDNRSRAEWIWLSMGSKGADADQG